MTMMGSREVDRGPSVLRQAAQATSLPSCMSRRPAPGDKVQKLDGESHLKDSSGAGAWTLLRGEVAIVVEVDAEGDFRLRNPAGAESQYTYRRYWGFVQEPSTQQILVSNDVNQQLDLLISDVNDIAPLNRHVVVPSPPVWGKQEISDSPHPIAKVPSQIFTDETATLLEDEFQARPVKICCFQIKSASNRRGVAKAAFWPAGKPLNHEKLGEIVFQTWNLKRPNLIIGVDVGTGHPANLSTAQLRQLPQFQSWNLLADRQRQMAKTRKQKQDGTFVPVVVAEHDDLERHQSGLLGTGFSNWIQHKDGGQDMKKQGSIRLNALLPVDEQDHEEIEKNREVVVNDCIFKKLVSIMAAIIDASAKTNNYIIIDRTSKAGSSSTAELLLEMALERAEVTPVILVVEKISRLKKYYSHEASHQLDVINSLEHHAIPHGTDTPLRKVEVNSLYTADEFVNESTFRGTRYQDRLLPTSPDPDHMLEAGKGVEVEYYDSGDATQRTSSRSGTRTAHLSPKRLWQYHYSQYLFPAGTHYVFLEDDNHVFSPEALGPMGAVFAHGGTLSYNRMMSWIEQGRPSVMLWNSGGVTQAFASLHSAVARCDNLDVDMDSLMRKIEITSNENWAAKFGVSECIMMNELKKRAPFFIRKAMVSVDILNDTAEDVLQVVTGCFSFGCTRLPELGLRTAEKHAVLRAWKQHLILYDSAMEMGRMSDRFFFLQTTLLLLTSAVAAFKAEKFRIIETAEEPDRIPAIVKSTFWDEFFYVSTIALPILAGLVSSALQQRRFLQKWCKLWSMSMCIVAEIYKFRARVLEYDTEGTAHLEAEKKDDEDADEKNTEPARRARVRFVKNVQRIFGDAAEGEMNSESLLVSEGGEDMHNPIDEKKLKHHVERNLLHLPSNLRTLKTRCCCCCRSRIVARNRVAARDTLDTKDIYNDVDEDDYKTTLSIEEYVEHRMKPLMKHFGVQSPIVSRRYRLLSSLSAIINALAVGLAVPREVNLSHWLTFAISVKVLIMNTMDYLGDSIQVTAFNSGVKDLQNLTTWWESLSVIDRRTRNTKTQAVTIVEQATLKAFTARTGEVPSIFKTAIGQRDEDGKAENKENYGMGENTS